MKSASHDEDVSWANWISMTFKSGCTIVVKLTLGISSKNLIKAETIKITNYKCLKYDEKQKNTATTYIFSFLFPKKNKSDK